jgi:hypothetical protein
MKLAHVAIGLATLGLGGASPPPARPVAIGKPLVWTADRYPRPLRLVAGKLSVTVRPIRSEGLVGPALVVAEAGRAPAALEGSVAGLTFPSRITILPWGRAGDLFLLLESFSGGAHCCNEVQAVVPEGRRLRVVPIGEFDGDRLARLPADIDGDGTVDFVASDDRFLYAFASYAGSLAPPKILDIVGGRAVDVSARPAFRPLFASGMAKARPFCVDRGGPEVNGACAAYVADAARAGRFAGAWAEMLRAYERPGGGPDGCRVAVRDDGACPEGQNIHYATFPRALRAFLVRAGYLAP